MAEQGAALSLAQIALPSGEIAGHTGLWSVAVEHGRVEIGMTWLAPRFRRTPINTETKLLLLQHAFDDLGAERVEFKTDARNQGSRAALRRIGAVEEGTLRRHMLLADGSWNSADMAPADIVVVPTIGAPIAGVLAQNTGLVDWLARQQTSPRLLASNCTGAFLLAEAGLLDGREATTHWGFSNQFRQRYPKVACRPEKLITVDGDIACAGGGMAWWDLGVYLVERYAGPDVARQLAKAFVIDAGRTSQAPYSALQAKRYHTDTTVLELTHNWDTDSYDLGDAYGHVALGVDDVYKACDDVRGRGGNVVRDAGPMKGGTTVIAFVKDPDGYMIELVEDRHRRA